MIVRRLTFLLLVFALSGVDGFSSTRHEPLRTASVTPTGAALMASQPGASRPHTGIRFGSTFPALYMAESSYSDAGKEPSRTQLQATREMAVETEATTITEATISSDLGERISQKAREIDLNEVINTSIVVLLSVAVLYKLTMVDAGMTRGWSVEEIAGRVAADNWSGYLGVLRDTPIATKAVTSATVYTIGDVIAQRTEGESMGSLDRPRIVRSLLAGLIGHGPLSHFWYEISEDFFNNVLHLTQWWSFIPKVAIDQTSWGPFWNNTYILLLGLMKRESLESIWGDMKRTTVPLIVSGLKLWPLAHCVTYGLIPVENRLLWVDLVEIVWVTILATQAAGVGQKEDGTVTQQEREPSSATSEK